MVKQTFINLPDAKKKRITAALLHEFSSYPLAKAQVARIVKEAGIARGAFYKYFADLTDAYLYLYRQAIRKIHWQINPTSDFKAAFFYDRVCQFINQTQGSKYEQLMKMQMLHNESALPELRQINSAQLLQMSPAMWSAMVLSHQTINSIFADPAQQKHYLARFKESLQLIERGQEK